MSTATAVAAATATAAEVLTPLEIARNYDLLCALQDLVIKALASRRLSPKGEYWIISLNEGKSTVWVDRGDGKIAQIKGEKTWCTHTGEVAHSDGTYPVHKEEMSVGDIFLHFVIADWTNLRWEVERLIEC